MKSKNLIISLIVLLSIFVIGLATGLFILIRKGYDLNFLIKFNKEKTKLVEKIEKETEEVNNIKLNVYSTDVEIKESDNVIRLEYYSNTEENAKIEFENGSIILDEQKYETDCIGFCNVNRKVVIYVPESYDGNYDIETTSGDISSKINMLNNTKIKTTSGDIKLNNTNNITINTTSGDIDINKINNKIDAKTTSGDIDINKLNIETNSLIQTTSGDVEIDNNMSGCYIETNSVSGDIKVSKSDRKSDLILKIKTTSGDISVN